MTTVTRQGVLAAVRAGRAAARTGRPVADCPHAVGSPDAGERVLARYWIRGYATATGAPALKG